jgi:hypothetical protein
MRIHRWDTPLPGVFAQNLDSTGVMGGPFGQNIHSRRVACKFFGINTLGVLAGVPDRM